MTEGEFRLPPFRLDENGLSIPGLFTYDVETRTLLDYNPIEANKWNF